MKQPFAEVGFKSSKNLKNSINNEHGRKMSLNSSLSFAIQLSNCICICILTWKLDEDTDRFRFTFIIFFFGLGHVTCDVKRNK